MLKYGHKYQFFGGFLAKNLKGEDDEYCFVLVSALRSANAFPYALGQ